MSEQEKASLKKLYEQTAKSVFSTRHEIGWAKLGEGNENIFSKPRSLKGSVFFIVVTIFTFFSAAWRGRSVRTKKRSAGSKRVKTRL